jgi:hypothetical protein
MTRTVLKVTCQFFLKTFTMLALWHGRVQCHGRLPTLETLQLLTLLQVSRACFSGTHPDRVIAITLSLFWWRRVSCDQTF